MANVAREKDAAERAAETILAYASVSAEWADFHADIRAMGLKTLNGVWRSKLAAIIREEMGPVMEALKEAVVTATWEHEKAVASLGPKEQDRCRAAFGAWKKRLYEKVREGLHANRAAREAAR